MKGFKNVINSFWICFAVAILLVSFASITNVTAGAIEDKVKVLTTQSQNSFCAALMEDAKAAYGNIKTQLEAPPADGGAGATNVEVLATFPFSSEKTGDNPTGFSWDSDECSKMLEREVEKIITPLLDKDNGKNSMLIFHVYTNNFDLDENKDGRPFIDVDSMGMDVAMANYVWKLVRLGTAVPRGVVLDGDNVTVEDANKNDKRYVVVSIADNTASVLSDTDGKDSKIRRIFGRSQAAVSHGKPITFSFSSGTNPADTKTYKENLGQLANEVIASAKKTLVCEAHCDFGPQATNESIANKRIAKIVSDLKKEHGIDVAVKAKPAVISDKKDASLRTVVVSVE